MLWLDSNVARPLWEFDQWSALTDWSRNAHQHPTVQRVLCVSFEKQWGREVESSNLSEPIAQADRMWVRQASLFVHCHGPERCGLTMMIMMVVIGTSPQVAALGAHQAACGLCWDPSLLDVVGKPVSTRSTSPGLESCCVMELGPGSSAL